MYQGIDDNFRKLVCKLQHLNKKSAAQQDAINKIGAKIQKEGLLDKCEDKDFARQLLIKNDVPEKYWSQKK